MESIRKQEQRLKRPTQMQNNDTETVYFTYTTAKEYSRLGEYEPRSFYPVTDPNIDTFSKISTENEFLYICNQKI